LTPGGEVPDWCQEHPGDPGCDPGPYAPQDDPPPPILCKFNGAQIPDPGWGTVPTRIPITAYGYHIPIYLNFVASHGSNGIYTWSDTQTVNVSGTVTWSDGTNIDLSTLPRDQAESLVNAAANPAGSSASFFDAPGFSLHKPDGATIVSAIVTWNFELQVSVSSGTQQTDCPIVWWSASLTRRTVNGKPVVTGSARIIVGPTP